MMKEYNSFQHTLYSGHLVMVYMSSIAFVFIPLFFKKKVKNQNLHVEPPKTISLKRYLIGSLGFIIILTSSVFFSEPDDRKRLQITNLFSLFAFDVLLAYHLSEKEAKYAAKRFLFNFFNIQEETHQDARFITLPSNYHSQQAQHSNRTEITNEGELATDSLQMGTFITVSPRATDE
jgi:hypothetical protein